MWTACGAASATRCCWRVRCRGRPGTVLARLDNLAYKHFALQDGELRLDFAGGLFRLERLRLRSYEVAAVLEGAFSPADSSGAFLLQFVRGELDEPDSSLEIPTRDQLLWQPPAEPGAGQLLLNVALRREGGYELAALGRELGLLELTGFADLGRELAGRLDLRASFTGTPQRPELELAFGIEELSYQGAELDSLGAMARLAEGRLMLDTLLLVQGDNRLGASAWVESGPEGPFAFGAGSPTGGAVIAPALNLELVELAWPQGQELEGVVGLDLRWRGRLGRPWVEGLVRVVEGAFHSGGEEEGGLGNIERINARLAFQDTVLMIDSLGWRVSDTPFALEGRIGLPGLGSYLADLQLYLADSLMARVEGSLSGAALDLVVKLDTVRLGVFQGMVPQLQRLAGTISADLTVAGSPSSPEVQGTIAVEELAFRPRDFEQGFFGGTMRLEFAGNRLQIDSLALLNGDRDEPGRFSVSGALSYQDGRFADLDLRLAARGVRLERKEVIDLTLQSADLSYTSQGEGYLLAGEVALGESRYYYELTPQQLLSALQSSAGPVQEPHPIQAGTRLDLRLDGGDAALDRVQPGRGPPAGRAGGHRHPGRAQGQRAGDHRGGLGVLPGPRVPGHHRDHGLHRPAPDQSGDRLPRGVRCAQLPPAGDGQLYDLDQGRGPAGGPPLHARVPAAAQPPGPCRPADSRRHQRPAPRLGLQQLLGGPDHVPAGAVPRGPGHLPVPVQRALRPAHPG